MLIDFINDFVNTEEYISSVGWFLLIAHHEGVCGKEKYRFFSSVGIEHNNRKQEGYIFKNVPNWLYKYCDGKNKPKELYAVIFGAWMGLDELSIKLLSSEKCKGLEDETLHALLCEANPVEVENVLDSKISYAKKAEKLYTNVPKFYAVEIAGKLHKAKRVGNWLITEDNKLRLEIQP